MTKDKRSQWDSSLSFLLAMVGSAVGLGNIWRFPYVAYTNGGGAFLIPYLVAIAVVGIPFLFIEYGAGYKFKAGLSKILRSINEKYEYIAWFIQVIPFLILTYYVCIIGWDLVYIGLSFFNGWGSDPNGFFINTLLQSTSDPMGLFNVVIPILISILVVWVVIWIISHKELNSGIAIASKVLIPLLFIIMICIVAYSITLPGAMVGISSLFTPDWYQIINVDIWLAAFGQIIFSLSLGLCIMLTYASYLPEDSDLVKSGLTVAITNSGFEVFTAIGIFGILGFMSVTQSIPLDSVVTEGTGLAFVAFPQVFNTMGLAGRILGPLFFICLLFAGITSAISLVEPISASFSEKFGLQRKRAVTLICIVGFCISVLFATSLGSTILGIFDAFLNKFGLLLTMILECIIFGWIYNIDDLLYSINKDSSIKLGRIWKFIIRYFIPILVTILWLTNLVDIFTSTDIVDSFVKLILLVLLIIVPIIFTKLPKKVEDY